MLVVPSLLMHFSFCHHHLQLQGVCFSPWALSWSHHGRRWENYKLKQLHVCPAVDTEVPGLVRGCGSHDER